MFNLTVCSIEKDKDPTDRKGTEQIKIKINFRNKNFSFASQHTLR